MNTNTEEIMRTICTLHSNDTFEIRVLGSSPLRGCFTEPAAAAARLSELHTSGTAAVSIDPVTPDTEQMNTLLPGSGSAVPAAHNWLPIYVTGTDSYNTSTRIYNFLKHYHGFPDPVIIDTESGHALLYKTDLAAGPTARGLFSVFLGSLSTLFDNDGSSVKMLQMVNLDSHVRFVPAKIETVSKDRIISITCPDVLPETPAEHNHYGTITDIKEWLKDHGIPYGMTVRESGDRKFTVTCPFCGQPEAVIIDKPNGIRRFVCFNMGCNTNGHRPGWNDFRRHYEPTAYEQESMNLNRERYESNKDLMKSNPSIFDLTGIDLEPPVGEAFKTAKDFRRHEKKTHTYVHTGVTELDAALNGGFRKGSVIMILGATGSGKTTFTTQCVAQALSEGKTVVHYSGELDGEDTVDWLYRQYSGPTRNYSVWDAERLDYKYFVPEETAEAIDKYFDGKYYLYDNNFGTNYRQFVPVLYEEIVKTSADLVVLDNMMFLEVGSDKGGGQWNEQTAFIKWLQSVAKKTNTAILLCVHPNGSARAPIRMFDCQGSANVYNACSDFLIMHRVDGTFKEKATNPRDRDRRLDIEEDSPLFAASNLIEIAKSRFSQHAGEFIPLYYDRKSYRLNNSPDGDPKVFSLGEYEPKSAPLPQKKREPLLNPDGSVNRFSDLDLKINI